MRKIIELTPEWVLEKIPHSHYSDGNGNSSVYTGNATDANWIELALESLNIEYETYDCADGNNEILFGFDFRIGDIKSECPSLHIRMKELDANNKIYKQLLKN
jgi:hypothetical protein